MSDSEEEVVQRVKKPRTPAQIAAVEKMIEGRRKSLALKKEQKEKEKLAKKEAKKAIKEKIIKETSTLNDLSVEQLQMLKEKAVSSPQGDNLRVEEPNIKAEVSDSVSDNDSEPVEKVKPSRAQQRKPRKPKKKVVINNYYDEESSESEEEEIVNNYYTKRKPKRKNVKRMARRPTKPPSPVESESSEEEYEEDKSVEQPQTYSNPNLPFNPMRDIIFC
jgi:hypothetical protein